MTDEPTTDEVKDEELFDMEAWLARETDKGNRITRIGCFAVHEDESSQLTHAYQNLAQALYGTGFTEDFEAVLELAEGDIGRTIGFECSGGGYDPDQWYHDVNKNLEEYDLEPMKIPGFKPPAYRITYAEKDVADWLKTQDITAKKAASMIEEGKHRGSS